MRFLYAFPFLLVAWTMLIFAYESNKDSDMGSIIIYAALALLFIYLAIKRYRAHKEKKPDIGNIIAINIGLLPLLYSNLFLTPIMLQGRDINESGMIYVLVLIYSPMMYIGTLVIIKLYESFRIHYKQKRL